MIDYSKHAVAAIRVSSTRQGIDGDSPEAQKGANRAICF